MRKGPGRPKRSGQSNPAGSKIARRIMKVMGIEWRGEVVRTGAITEASDSRKGRPKGWASA